MSRKVKSARCKYIGDESVYAEVGRFYGISSIDEEIIGGVVSYLVTKSDGNKYRMFNPIYVEYVKE